MANVSPSSKLIEHRLNFGIQCERIITTGASILPYIASALIAAWLLWDNFTTSESKRLLNILPFFIMKPRMLFLGMETPRLGLFSFS